MSIDYKECGKSWIQCRCSSEGNGENQKEAGR